MAGKTTTRESEIRAIQMNLSRLEQLGVQRATLMAIVEQDVKAIDAGRKTERENLQGHLANIKDVTLATAAANDAATSRARGILRARVR